MITVIENATDLDVACLELARTTKWVRRPIDADEILQHAQRLSEIARDQVDEGLGRDVALVTRAVRYLANTHGIPPMRDDTGWFYDMLCAVLEVARPNCGQDSDGREFLKDMQEGIQSILED